MSNKDFKRHIAYEVLVFLGLLALLIERIYGDSFLDITDLNQLPVKLTAVIKRFMK